MNKNFAAGFKSTSAPEVVCVGEGPAAVNNDAVVASSSGERQVVDGCFHGMLLDGKGGQGWCRIKPSSFRCPAAANMVTGEKVEVVVGSGAPDSSRRFRGEIAEPANVPRYWPVSSHSNITPSAAPLYTSGKGLLGVTLHREMPQ